MSEDGPDPVSKVLQERSPASGSAQASALHNVVDPMHSSSRAAVNPSGNTGNPHGPRRSIGNSAVSHGIDPVPRAPPSMPNVAVSSQVVSSTTGYTPRYAGNGSRYGVSYIGGGSHLGGRQDPGRWFNIWGGSRRPQQRRGTCFVTAVIMFIGFEYAAYTITVLPSILHPNVTILGVTYIVLFHLLFMLLVTAFIKTSITDPGVVPGNWGFYMGDDCKRRRYCKVCHVWKPDRTHHCSACGRCVLNMDHHCPWVNNCIGYENRKFFIQLLCYAIACVSCIVIHGTHFLLTEGSDLFPQETTAIDVDPIQYLKDIGSFASAVIMLLLAVLLGIPLIPFTKFHLTMIARNSSTIENMDVLSRSRGRYDLGTMRNLEQVLGPNPWLWWVPCHTRGSRPVGDGVRWRQQYWKAVESADV